MQDIGSLRHEWLSRNYCGEWIYTNPINADDNATAQRELRFGKHCMKVLSDYFRNLDKGSDSENLIFSVVYALITIFGCVGNGMMIFVVLRNKSMRTTRNVYIVNLALSNFILSILVYPFLWIPDRDRRFDYGSVACKLATAFPGSNIYCSTLTIAMISVDRFYATNVRNKFRRLADNMHNAVIVSVLIWMISLVLSIPLIIFYDTAQRPKGWSNIKLISGGTGSFSWELCQLAPGWNQDKFLMTSIFINLIQSTFLYIVPLFVLILFNIKLTRYINQNTMLPNRSSQTPLQQTHLVNTSAGASTRTETHKHRLVTNHHNICSHKMATNGGVCGTIRKSRTAISLDGARVHRTTTTNHTNGTEAAGGNPLTKNTPHTRSYSSCAVNDTDSTNGPGGGTSGLRPKSASTTSALQMARFNAAERRRNRMLRLLILMSTTYGVLWLPYTVITILLDYQLITPYFFDDHRSVDYASKALSMLTICVNPFVYGYLNTNFNLEFRMLYRSVAERISSVKTFIGRSFLAGIRNIGNGIGSETRKKQKRDSHSFTAAASQDLDGSQQVEEETLRLTE